MLDFVFKKQLKKLPAKPGIYLFKDSRNKSLYIGKALSLKNRVRNYLKTSDTRLRKMVELAHSLKIISTSSEIEALILESQLIKKFRPPFNVVMRDDKQYSFVMFTDEKYQKILTTHQPQSHQETIGPFTDAGALKTTLRLLRRIFPYCTCKQLHNNFCLNYHIGKCLGFCCLKKPVASSKSPVGLGPLLGIKYQVLRDYKKNIRVIKDILSGKKEYLIKRLEKEMKQMAKSGNLEKAIELRDKISKLKRVFENAKIIGNWKLKIGNSGEEYFSTLKNLKQTLNLPNIPRRVEGYDISNIQGTHATGAMVTFVDGQPNKNFYRKFKIKTKQTPDDTAMLKEILERRFKHSEWPFPDLILVDGGKGQVNTAIKTLKEMAIKIQIIGISKNDQHMGHQLIIPGRKSASWRTVSLSKLSPADKNLLLAIDSEAHRFAINYYREKHRRSFLTD